MFDDLPTCTSILIKLLKYVVVTFNTIYSFCEKYICICKKNIMNVIKVKLRLCESSVKNLNTLLFDVTFSGTNILRDVLYITLITLSELFLSMLNYFW